MPKISSLPDISDLTDVMLVGSDAGGNAGNVPAESFALADGVVVTLVPGTGISINNSDPQVPIVSINTSDIATAAQGVKADNAALLLNGMATTTPFDQETRQYTDVAIASFLTSETDFPEVGPAAVHGRAEGNLNGVLGEALQNNTPGDYSFPCAVIASGQLDSAGNQLFGFFGRVDAHSAGVVTHELNTFNFNADAPASYPWSRAFGIATTVPVGLTIAAGGDNLSAAAIEIGQEGSDPNAYQFGIALQKKGVKVWSYYQDADATDGPTNGAYLAIPGSGYNLLLKTTGSATAKNAVLRAENAAGNERASIRQDGSANFGAGAGASGLASRLNVQGSDTIRGIANTVAVMGVDLASGSALGACVQIGSTNGNTPFIAASRYSTSDATASPLMFLTDATERMRLLAAPGNGIGIKTPVPANSYADDTAAAAAGIAVGEWYRTGSAVKIRVS